MQLDVPKNVNAPLDGFAGLHPSFSCREPETNLFFLGCVYVCVYLYRNAKYILVIIFLPFQPTYIRHP